MGLAVVAVEPAAAAVAVEPAVAAAEPAVVELVAVVAELETTVKETRIKSDFYLLVRRSSELTPLVIY